MSTDDGGRVAIKGILKRSLPVTLASGLIPLSGLLDSILSVRLMTGYAANAVSLYGLFSGGAVTIINLPVSVCYGLAAASIPAVAGETESGRRRKKKVVFALLITLLVSIPCAVGLYLFAPMIVGILFRSLQEIEKQTLVELVKVFSISAVTLSATQTLSACLTAQGKPQYAALSMLIAITVKTAAYVLLLRNPEISVFGMAHATNLCYLVAFSLNLLYNFTCKRNKERKSE